MLHFFSRNNVIYFEQYLEICPKEISLCLSLLLSLDDIILLLLLRYYVITLLR